MSRLFVSEFSGAIRSRKLIIRIPFNGFDLLVSLADRFGIAGALEDIVGRSLIADDVGFKRETLSRGVIGKIQGNGGVSLGEPVSLGIDVPPRGALGVPVQQARADLDAGFSPAKPILYRFNFCGGILSSIGADAGRCAFGGKGSGDFGLLNHDLSLGIYEQPCTPIEITVLSFSPEVHGS